MPWNFGWNHPFFNLNSDMILIRILEKFQVRLLLRLLFRQEKLKNHVSTILVRILVMEADCIRIVPIIFRLLWETNTGRIFNLFFFRWNRFWSSYRLWRNHNYTCRWTRTLCTSTKSNISRGIQYTTYLEGESQNLRLGYVYIIKKKCIYKHKN